MPPENDDVHAKHDEGEDLGIDDPASDAAAAERRASAMVQRYLDDFQLRAEGLQGEELEGELDRLYEVVHESHAGLPPGARRATPLDHVCEMLTRHPSRRRWWTGMDPPEVAHARGESTSATTDPDLRHGRRARE